MPKELKISDKHAALLIRRAKQAEEAVSANAEYAQNARNTIELTAKLRAERLARPVSTVVVQKPKRKSRAKVVAD